MNNKIKISLALGIITCLLFACSPELPTLRTDYIPEIGMTKGQVGDLSILDGKTYKPFSLFGANNEGNYIMDEKTKSPMAILFQCDENEYVKMYMVKYQTSKRHRKPLCNKIISFLERKFGVKFQSYEAGKFKAETDNLQLFATYKPSVSFAVVSTDPVSSSKNNTKDYGQSSTYIESTSIKKVGGKYRYFFTLKNGERDINYGFGIVLKTGTGMKLQSTVSMAEGTGGTGFYVDFNTGPFYLQSMGANGIKSFTYTLTDHKTFQKTRTSDITRALENYQY